MSHFVLGVLIPLPCDDPLEAVEQTMRPLAGEGNRTDGWELLELQWSSRVDATPYAYLDLQGNWHERAPERYPEERERDARQHVIVVEHLGQYGYTHLEDLRKKREAVPEAITNWHREWQQVTKAQVCIVAFIWCHV